MSYSTITLKIEELQGLIAHQRTPKKFSMSMKEAEEYLKDEMAESSYYMGRTLVDYHKVITQKIAEIVYKDYIEGFNKDEDDNVLEDLFENTIQIEDPRLVFDIRSHHYFLQYVVQARNEDKGYDIQSIYVVSSIRLTPRDEGLPHEELRLFQEDCN